MIVQIQDLKKGDEILSVSNGRFRYYKLLEDPKLLKARPQDPGRDTRYGGVKCSTRMIETSRPGWGGRPYKEKKYECTPFEHNYEERINLNWRSMWLVRREEI